MYRTAYQRGMFTVLYSCGAKPLALWDVFIKDGYINKFLDPDIKSTVFEIGGSNVSTTYMVCPKDNKILGITMPFLVLVVKNLKKYFSFEITALDETGTRRRFRVSNFQSTTQVMPLCTVMPLALANGWNRIQFNMAEFMRRAYNKQFTEVQKLKINANIRIRRIYFADILLPEDKLPTQYRLFFPMSSKNHIAKTRVENKENILHTTSMAVIGSDAEVALISKTDIAIRDINLAKSNLRVTGVNESKNILPGPVVSKQDMEASVKTVNEDEDLLENKHLKSENNSSKFLAEDSVKDTTVNAVMSILQAALANIEIDIMSTPNAETLPAAIVNVTDDAK